MKKVLLLVAVAAAMTACTSDVDLGMQQANKENADNAIGFQVLNKNMSRASLLQNEDHFNFGVWAYKSTDPTNEIMADYLVGYMDNANHKGYKFENASQSTLTTSQWAYEKLGTSQYLLASNVTGESYYTTNGGEDNRYLSNNAEQWLRYWDKSAPTTNFYAYAPYVNKTYTSTTGVTYDNTTHKMTFPSGSIVAGYDDRDKYEFLFAGKQVASGTYGNEVELAFRHLNAKVRITFYEVIDGYSVTMKSLKGGTHDFISAVPAIIGDPTYTRGDVWKTAGATITFNSPSYESADASFNFTGERYPDTEYLKFNVPTASPIATSFSEATANPGTNLNYSSTVYYAIPKSNTTGLTFHVSFELKSTTGERILVKNATVHVGKDNCNWEANKAYTYVFKITKKSSGTTELDPSIDPSDPTPSTSDALFPIIFDNCSVEDWAAATETEHPIN